MSNRQEICRRYQRTGQCQFGDNCRYLHKIRRLSDEIDDRYQIQKSNNKTNRKNNRLKKVNTESYEPNYKPADMRILVEVPKAFGKTKLTIQPKDVIIIPGLFCDDGDFTIYNNLLKEMDECGIQEDKLWKLWHGDTHLIADDHMNYKDKVPTFMSIINKIRDYFDMDIKATRFNWYRSEKDWKPYHHDASAVDPKKAKIQNFTVGVSFGATRDIAFEDAQESVGHRRTISIPLINGTLYCFSRDINIHWRHGVPQLPIEIKKNNGRISIIAWGFVNILEI